VNTVCTVCALREVLVGVSVSVSWSCEVSTGPLLWTHVILHISRETDTEAIQHLGNEFYIFLTVHLRIIPVGNQTDAQFLL